MHVTCAMLIIVSCVYVVASENDFSPCKIVLSAILFVVVE